MALPPALKGLGVVRKTVSALWAAFYALVQVQINKIPFDRKPGGFEK